MACASHSSFQRLALDEGAKKVWDLRRNQHDVGVPLKGSNRALLKGFLGVI